MKIGGTKKTLKGGLILTLGKLGGYGCAFARNVVISRMLARDDVGFSLLLISIITLFEFSGRLGLGMQVIQAKRGAGSEFIGSAQTFQLVTGIVAAFLLTCMAVPLSDALNEGEAAWAFLLLAAVPMIRAFENLRFLRLQRHLRFGAAAIYEFVPQVVTLMLVWPVANWLGDWRTILVLIGVRTVLGVVITNIVAGSIPVFRWKREKLLGMWKFGYPLLGTAGLMFLIQQADQFSLAAMLSLSDVARYGLALSIVMVPWMIISEVCKQIMLPRLSRAARDDAAFSSEIAVSTGLSALLGALGLVPLIAAGGLLMELFFGPKYAGNGAIIGFLGAAVLIRFVRFVPALAATAKGKTGLHLKTNMVRGISFPVAAILLMLKQPVEAVAVTALFAEIAALIYSWWMLEKTYPATRGSWKQARVIGIGAPLLAGLAHAVVANVPHPEWGAAITIVIAEIILIGAGIHYFGDILGKVIDVPALLKRKQRA